MNRKTGRRTLCAALLAFALALCAATGIYLSMPEALAANAENYTASWSEVADTSWYNENQTEFELSTAEQLAGLAKLTNENDITFDGKTISLTADIDLAGREWIPISADKNNFSGFSGMLDGNRHIISNMNVTDSDLSAEGVQNGYHKGLFGAIADGTVQNLGLENIYVYMSAESGYFRQGGLTGWISGGLIFNCYTTGSIICEQNLTTIGGIAGQAVSGTEIIGCYSECDIQSITAPEDADDLTIGSTVGGIVGQWENATEDALISDSWFGGSISAGNIGTAISGILGANFDLYDDQPGVDINNCLCLTTDFESYNPANILYIAALFNGQVTNCYWPEPWSETMPDEDVEHAPPMAIVKMTVDWNEGVAYADPEFSQTDCGEAVSDFSTPAILESLNENTTEGIAWVSGTDGPTLAWDIRNQHTHESGDGSVETFAPFAGADGVLTEGNYFLEEDAQIEAVTIDGAVTLCLNGHILSNTDAITVNSGATLTICDCSGTQSGSVAGDIEVTGGGIFKLQSGNVSGNIGIYIHDAENANVTMEGGTVSGILAGVMIESGEVSVKITGGSVYGERLGIMVDSRDASVEMSAGSVTGGRMGINVNDASEVVVTGGFISEISDAGGNANITGGYFAAAPETAPEGYSVVQIDENSGDEGYVSDYPYTVYKNGETAYTVGDVSANYGEAYEPEIGGNTYNVEVTYSYSDPKEGTVNGLPVNAGNYDVTATFATYTDGTNKIYYPETEVVFTVDISGIRLYADIEVSVDESGTAHVNYISVSGVADGDDVTVTPLATVLGDGKVKVEFELNGTTAGKYFAPESVIVEIGTDLNDIIAGLEADLADAVADLEEAIAAKDNSAALTQAVADLTAAYEAADALINADITAIEGGISALEGALDGARTALQESIDAVQASLESEIERLEGLISSGGADTAELENALAALDTAYKAADALLRTDFAAADTALAGEIAADLAGLEASLESADEAIWDAIEALQAAVHGNSSNIDGLTTALWIVGAAAVLALGGAIAGIVLALRKKNK